MDRTSFYGGPAGQSFEIKRIFKNKKEMLTDLQLRWQSSIGVSDFVVISYGLPGTQDTDDFLNNQTIDNDAYGESYNSTIWQKIYTENNSDQIDALSGVKTYYVSGNYGLGYKLIASMSGNTPQITLYTKILHSYETPYWKYYMSPDSTYPETELAGIDRPVIIAFLPMAQQVTMKKVSLNAEDSPVFYWDITTNSYNYPDKAVWNKSSSSVDRSKCGSVKSSYDSDHNAIADGNDNPILWLGIPPGWDWDLDYDTLKPNQDPTVEIDDNGNTQTLIIRLPKTWQWDLDYDQINADQDPFVDLNQDADLATSTLQIQLPKTWQWDLDYSQLNADQDPFVDLNQDASTAESILQIQLPQHWGWDLDYNTSAAGTAPTMSLECNDNNTQTLIATLPVPWDWNLSKTIVLNADEDPAVDLSDSGNSKYLQFSLPQSQIMASPDTDVVAPLTDPDVTLDSSNINSPKLTFSLPRAVRFYYGGLLGGRSAGTYTLTNDTVKDYEPGDYYINQTTGFVYQVTANNNGTVTFQYVACLQAPLPTVTTNSIDPYTAEGASKVDPSITQSFDNLTELTGWKLVFNLPHLPDFSVKTEFVGAAEEGGATVIPDAEDNVTFHLTLPQGSRMYAGTELSGTGDITNPTITDSIVGDAKPGDLYLNTEEGTVYKLNTSGVWEYQNKGLKGPVGDALNIVRNYTLTATETYENTLTNGVNYIIENYVDSDGNPIELSPDEIFAVTWIETEEDSEGAVISSTETAYWYFYTEEGKWGRIQVTGGVSDIIIGDYTDGTDGIDITNKTYSIEYINSLIGGNITDENKDTTTFSKDQIYALLSWSTFEEAESGNWWPDLGEDTDTLSAEEVYNLLSWGSFTSII